VFNCPGHQTVNTISSFIRVLLASF